MSQSDLFVLCATREEELKEPEACVSQTAVGVAEEKPNMFILHNNAEEKRNQKRRDTLGHATSSEMMHNVNYSFLSMSLSVA